MPPPRPSPRRELRLDDDATTDETDDQTIDLRDRLVGDFGALGAALPVGVVAVAGMATVVYLNEAAATMLDRPEAELLGRSLEDVVVTDLPGDLAAALAVVLDTGARQRFVVGVADVPERCLEFTVAPLGGRQPVGWIATVDDVSDRVRTERRLAFDATHDQLTRLPNRALLADRIRQAGRRLERAAAPAVLAVLFIDLDDFKAVNDRFGHAAGDEVLRTTAARLVAAVRAGDTVARLGGDEFVAVCELGSADEADALADRLRRALAVPIDIRDATVRPRASVGVALAARVEDADELVSLADEEMYRHKPGRVEDPPAGDPS